MDRNFWNVDDQNVEATLVIANGSSTYIPDIVVQSDLHLGIHL